MTTIFVVEYQDYITGRIIQHGFALTESKAEEFCNELHKRRGGNRLDYWVTAYFVKDDNYTTFD